MTELEKRLEELSFRREYRYIEQIDMKNVKRILHKQKRKPLIIEFAGVPKSGKSTCIEAVKKILSVNGFNVKVIEEKAPKCPLNKFNIMFNFWTYTNFLNELNEILQYNERFWRYAVPLYRQTTSTQINVLRGRNKLKIRRSRHEIVYDGRLVV